MTQDKQAAQPSASLPDVVMPEPVAWRYQRDTQANPGVPDGKWRLMEHGKQALELQGKRSFTANTSFHCWEPLFAAQPAEGSAQVTLQARSPEGDPWQEVTAANFFKAHANGYEVSACVHSPGKNSIRLTVAAPERSDTPADRPTDEQIVVALHACGIDTRPSKYGFDALQIDGASVPSLRNVFIKLAAASKSLDAAAPVGLTDVVEALRSLCTHDKRSSEQINRDWDHARSVLARIDGDKQGAQSDIESFNRSLRSPAVERKECMNTKFTPGPWQLNYDGQVTTANGKYIVGFHWDSYKEFSDMDAEHKGNCRLIAAAPDLLAALEQALYQMEHDAEKIEGEWGVGRKLADLEADDEMPEVIIRARAAIAQATGRQA